MPKEYLQIQIKQTMGKQPKINANKAVVLINTFNNNKQQQAPKIIFHLDFFSSNLMSKSENKAKWKSELYELGMPMGLVLFEGDRDMGTSLAVKPSCVGRIWTGCRGGSETT